MATSIPANPTPQTVNSLLSKMSDNDPDFRFMALNDLQTVLANGKPDFLHHDYNTAARTVDSVVKALDDQNGEVQNLAIKVLAPLIKKIPKEIISPLMEKLSTLKLKNSVDNAVPALAMKVVVEALPRPQPGIPPSKEVLESSACISRILIPRFLGRSVTGYKSGIGLGNMRLPAVPEGLLENDQDLSSDSVDVLIEVVRCFGPVLQSVEIEALQDAVVNLLEKDRGNSVVKKRAVVAVSMLANYLGDDLLARFIARAVGVLSEDSIAPVTRRLYITILGSMARSIPHRFGEHIAAVVPFVLQALSDEELQEHLEEIGDSGDSGIEFNEVREAALVALEAFLSACPTQMRPFTDQSLASCLRYLKFDPNYAVDDDDEEMDVDDDDEEDGLEDDDEFEADAGFDDDDDASWKVRRCAAKALYTVISTRSSGDLLDNGVLYTQVAPPLIKRFDEREENVRLEVISALSLLIRKTGEGIIPEFSIDSSQNEYLSQNPPSRKRRRQSSGGGAAAFGLTITSSDLPGTGLTSPTKEKVPATGPRADLARLTPSVVKGATKLLKGKAIPSKQATVNLLDDMIAVQRGGLDDYFEQIMDPLVEAIKTSSASAASTSLSAAGGNASATPSTLRIAALRLMSDVAKNHSSSVLHPYLPKIVSGVVVAVHDRFYKISVEAIQTAEEIAKALTPPRSRATAQKYKAELQNLYDVVVDRTIATDADTEVRQKAIHALGTLLARTSGGEASGLIPDSKRKAGLDQLLSRLQNETTRLAAVRAIDSVAALSTKESELDPKWVRAVVVELAAQLRKANRALRGSSIQGLKHLILSPASKGSLDKETVQNVVTAIVGVIANNDAQLLGPGFLVLAHLVQDDPDVVVTPQLITSLCDILRNTIKATIATSVLDSLLVLVNNIGQAGKGQALMAALLQNVSINGDPAVVGKVIGSLLVSSGESAGVSLDSFVQESKTNTGDPARVSLALAVLGEAGLRMGANFPLNPEIFLQQFNDNYDKVSMSAALALGRAGAGNVPQYLPVILKAIQTQGSTQYLLLQSIKEILQQVASSSTDISAYSGTIWDQLLATAYAEDNKAVCAECIGRLVIIDPKTYMAKLEALLRNESATLRAIAVQALRFTLPDENEVFDGILKSYLVDMLKTMLEDSEMDIRRHAMSTLTSAAHNKPELIHAQLGQLLPFVMRESVIKKELIREVQMGPFKHLVDDGLEVRKAAYETLYALMETAFSRVSIIDLYDRIIAGLRDDNDIRALCNLMVSKLIYLDPDETVRRLDSIAEAYRATLSTKLKDSAVKQEHEKQDEANKSVLRVTLLLGDKLKAAINSGPSAGAAGSYQVWNGYWDWVNKDFGPQLRTLKEESKEI